MTTASNGLSDRVRRLIRRSGFDVVRLPGGPTASPYPPDFSADVLEVLDRIEGRTMTSPERVNALCAAVRYVAENDIPGDIVECGVWRGGSMMAVALTLQQLGDTSRRLHLFDTFEGMPAPTAEDQDLSGRSAQALLQKQARSNAGGVWAIASLDDVRDGMAATSYPADGLHYVAGRVEDTIPEQAPSEIAILRLDTDWYESTRHELIHLFPRIADGGVLIIDDYGHWQGARRAVDEYLAEHRPAILLNRVDYTGRVAVVSARRT